MSPPVIQGVYDESEGQGSDFRSTRIHCTGAAMTLTEPDAV